VLGFKHLSDRDKWRSGAGPIEARRRISLFNAISEAVTGKSAMVTSWHRDDTTWHNPDKCGDMVIQCCDFRTRIYDDDQLVGLLHACTEAGLPVVSLYRGKPNQHIHLGDIMTLVYEVE
jgi:hypothetical protein